MKLLPNFDFYSVTSTSHALECLSTQLRTLICLTAETKDWTEENRKLFVFNIDFLKRFYEVVEVRALNND
jgi:hypothetical protein